MTARVVVLDAGAPGNIGWAAVDVDTSDDGSWQARQIVELAHGSSFLVDRGEHLEQLVEVVAEAVDHEVPVALGVEAPCFVPVRRDETTLLRGRCGEGNRPFAAGAGAPVLVAGLVEAAWTLSQLGAWAGTATVDPAAWPNCHPILLWEAFVAGAGKLGVDSRALPEGWGLPTDTPNIRDAATAAAAFIRRGRPSLVVSDIDTCGEPAFNLLAAAALRAGVTTDVGELSRRSYTVKAV